MPKVKGQQGEMLSCPFHPIYDGKKRAIRILFSLIENWQSLAYWESTLSVSFAVDFRMNISTNGDNKFYLGLNEKKAQLSHIKKTFCMLSKNTPKG
jgi:hypothetical protein